jgi:hypothetical protein
MPTRAEIVAAVEEYVGAVGRHDLEATLACSPRTPARRTSSARPRTSASRSTDQSHA